MGGKLLHCLNVQSGHSGVQGMWSPLLLCNLQIENLFSDKNWQAVIARLFFQSRALAN